MIINQLVLGMWYWSGSDRIGKMINKMDKYGLFPAVSFTEYTEDSTQIECFNIHILIDSTN